MLVNNNLINNVFLQLFKDCLSLHRNTYTLKEGHVNHLMKMMENAFGIYFKGSTQEEMRKTLKVKNYDF